MKEGRRQENAGYYREELEKTGQTIENTGQSSAVEAKNAGIKM